MKVHVKNKVFLSIGMLLASLLLLLSCREAAIPKPRAYFRIDFPEKSYKSFTSSCNFSFEYPEYSKVDQVDLATAEPCWYDIKAPQYKATIHLTYKPLKNDLASHIEDVRRIVNKHIVKADNILETPINEDGKYGIIYDIKGNTASSVNFYVTDSVSGFINGSLYFNVPTNKDSLAPAIQFFREDIVHLINTFQWD